MIIKEVCVENFTNVPNAILKGANRIELCDNLSVGGTTVSNGVMVETQKYADEHNIPVMAIIRPRGGNFIFNDTEVKIMEHDIFQAQQMGLDGIVIGALTKEKQIDTDVMEQLVAAAGGMQITFHMAFDEIKNQEKALKWLIENKFDRVLTHGGDLKNTSIEDNLNNIKKLIKYAENKIKILPGGGINKDNYKYIADTLSINEVHGTKLV